MKQPHGSHLRKGRVSITGQVYSITTVTADRVRVFSNFYNARALVQVLKEQALLRRADTLAYVIMPDHLHWLVQLCEYQDISDVVGSMKSISARRIGRPIWQSGFHDHALRAEENVRHFARYIIANPLRAGLVSRVSDYPHWDAVWL